MDFKEFHCIIYLIDAYIAFILQAEIEKGNHITMYPSQTMTGIMSGTYSVEKCRKKVALLNISLFIIN